MIGWFCLANGHRWVRHGTGTGTAEILWADHLSCVCCGMVTWTAQVYG